MNFLIVVLWLILSVVVASVARRRGFAWGAYFAHSLLASPWIAMVTLHRATHAESNAPVPTPA